MQIVFEREYLADLYYNQISDKKHRFQPEVIKKYTYYRIVESLSVGVMGKHIFNATHPGEVLKDELEARGISQKEFATCIGVPYTMLNDILNQRRPLSVTVALLVEQALGISADLLVGLQTDYSMQRARNDEDIKKRMRAVQPINVGKLAC